MESIEETPTKRRKTHTGYVTNDQAYDSQDESGDTNTLFGEFETVATVPIQQSLLRHSTPDLPSSPATYITQPTQIKPVVSSRLGESNGRTPSIVQVAASSPGSIPLSSPSRPTDTQWQGGKLASLMAPAGTSYRAPVGVLKTNFVELSDDEGPTYRGGSSDEESQKSLKSNIKPSTFIQSAQAIAAENAVRSRTSDLPNGGNRFKEILSSSFYKPIEASKVKGQGSSSSGSVYLSSKRYENQITSKIGTVSKQSSDVMANAYGSSSRPVKQARLSQTSPAKAESVEDISLDDIEDYQFRIKIKRIQAILPQKSVAVCRNALLRKRGNYDDALEFLSSQPEEVDQAPLESDFPSSQTSKQEEMPGKKPAKSNKQPAKQTATEPATKPSKPPAKQQVKAPVKSIMERWAGTQPTSKPPQPSPASPTALKPRRRLVQGQRQKTTPAHAISSPPQAKRGVAPDSDQSDSGLGAETDDVEREDIENKVLKFLNNCSVSDLVDIAAVSDDLATLILSHKPFRKLDEARRVTNKVSTKGTRKPQQPIGDKLVDKCIDMWTGYEAVDILVSQCESLGKPVAEEMKKWGVNVFGAVKDGELDLVSFEKRPSGRSAKGSVRDSGIGTPDSDDFDRKEPFNQTQNAFFPQPEMMSQNIVLKDYQIVGINWLALLFQKNLSCILADDMGLGKTCQVIAFLAHLWETGIKGPHLVVVPGSTLENWLQEFSAYCPDLSVMPYYASIKERAEVREYISDNIEHLNVIVTTYDMAKKGEDNKFLRHLKPVVCVYDEGHVLKNSKSAAYTQLMRIPAQFRLLLTGTPLQNNLTELVSLLGFILPSVFREHSDDLEYIFRHKAKTAGDTHAALLSSQRISRAKSMMTPFVLRRKKHQVLKYLPKKTRRVEYCELSPAQASIYEGEKAKAAQAIGNKAAANIMMALRQASIHRLLFRRLYNDEIVSKMSKACLQEEEFHDSNVDLVYEDMSVMTDMELHVFCQRYPSTMSDFLLRNDEWMDSGKVSKLCELLRKFKENGDRVLIFSQFTMVMNILEAVLETLSITFFRLDGQTKIDERQDMIDQFYQEEDIMVFLLSTKAGGAGINLACANKVVIFDLSYNPQEDIQAENRAHRLGQKREVEVIRLVTRGTIEEQIHALGETKLALDARVAGDAEGGGAVDQEKVEKQGAKTVEEVLLLQIKVEEEKKSEAVVTELS